MSTDNTSKVDNDLTSYLIIRSENSASARFSAVAVGNSDLPSTLQLMISEDLHSSLQVTPKNKMSGILLKVIPQINVDLPSTLETKSMSGLLSSLFIKPDNEMEGITRVWGYGQSDLAGSIIPMVNTNLPSSLSIRPYSKMEGIAEIEEPPVFKSTFTPIKDTFIRSGLHRLNYGDYLDTYIGKSGDEIFRSLFQFNISSLPTGKILKQATLTLSPANHVNAPINISVKEVLDDWSEAGTTWDNKPNVGSSAKEFSSGTEFTNVDIDLTELVKSWYVGEKVNKGISLEALDETINIARSFYTRESSYKPKLVVEYYEPFVNSYGRSNVKSNLFVMSVRSSDLPSKIKIIPVWWDNELPSSLEVNDPNDVGGSVFVNKPSLVSSIAVYREDYTEIPSSLTIRREGEGDGLWLEGSILPRAIRSKDLHSSLVVKYAGMDDIDSILDIHLKNDLASVISPRVSKANNLPSKLEVHVLNDLPSSILVHQVNGLNSTVGVRVKGEVELDSSLTIHNTYDMPSSITVSLEDSLRGSMVVKYVGKDDLLAGVTIHKKSDLQGSLYVLNDNYHGSIDVHQVVQMQSLLKVRVKGFKDLPSTLIPLAHGSHSLPSSLSVRVNGENNFSGKLTVRVETVNDLHSTIAINKKSDLDSSIHVRSKKYVDIPSNIEVHRVSEISSSVTVHRTSDIASGIAVRAVDKEELPSSIDIHVFKDLPSVLSVTARNDLHASVYVKYTGDSNLGGTVEPRVMMASDLQSSLEVYSSSALPSTIKPRAKDSQDLPASVDVHEVADLPSTIMIHWTNDLDSSLFIKKTGFADLGGKLLPRVRLVADLHSSIQVNSVSDLESTLVIPVRNKMSGTVFEVIGISNVDLPSNIEVITAYPYAYIM